MSITYWVPDAPMKTVECEFCAWEKEHAEKGEKAQPCHAGCDGTMEVSVAPECNFSNRNAHALMEAIGFPIIPDCGGEIAVKDLPALMRRLIFMINTGVAKQLSRPAYEDTGANGATCIYVGASEFSMQYRLRALQEVASYAAEHKHTLAWG